MIGGLIILVQLAVVAAPQPGGSDCTKEELKALEISAQMVARGDDAAAGQAVDRGARGSTDSCALITLARLSLVGWVEARKLAPAGGAVELLGPANHSLAELDALKTSALALDVEYAQTALRAAIAAAQDERPELGLLLTHARDLAERILARGRRAMWPRPYNVLAGELWLEVDRYEDARLAFERAVTAEQSPLALVGLAESLSRLGRHEEACAAYRRVRGARGPLSDQLRMYLTSCP